MYRRFGKRWLDLSLTIFGLIVLWPVLIVLLILVRINLGRPVLFRQQRPGFMERPFTIYKFRSMTDARGVDGKLFPDDERLTAFGSFLRSTSLDELPELINVLKGEMSLVGPRPLLMKYLSHYTPGQRRRHSIRPGITGWAQINGRNTISWEEKFAQDIWYVENYSFWLDLKILGFTVLKIIRREDINHPNHVTMSEFEG